MRRACRSVRFFVLATAIGAIGVTFSAQRYSPEESRTPVRDMTLAAAVETDSPCREKNPFIDSCSSTVSTVATKKKTSWCKDIVPGILSGLCPDDDKKSAPDPKGEHVPSPPITPPPADPIPTNMPRPSEQQPPSTIASPVLTVVSWVSWFVYALVVGSIIWLGLRMAVTYRTGEGGGHLRVAGLLFLCCVMLAVAPSIVRAAL
ncbi:hypothetical protein [Actinoallomurus iriomotensis]|uniref:Uncharacterized protein n=1 Tax=Actinoallomurus iriomotensis TaxID=478107 RepID=A0A9W6RRD9_9ACTN|nr:hypothetical protein [Actinoallomurus iriomotensis]GLY80449.1 hypothetical protein Airi01_087160 [Actinoallomurus iriomotensis]